MNNVIVIGGNHHNTLSVLRALGESLHTNASNATTVVMGGVDCISA